MTYIFIKMLSISLKFKQPLMININTPALLTSGVRFCVNRVKCSSGSSSILISVQVLVQHTRNLDLVLIVPLDVLA